MQGNTGHWLRLKSEICAVEYQSLMEPWPRPVRQSRPTRSLSNLGGERRNRGPASDYKPPKRTMRRGTPASLAKLRWRKKRAPVRELAIGLRLAPDRERFDASVTRSLGLTSVSDQSSGVSITVGGLCQACFGDCFLVMFQVCTHLWRILWGFRTQKVRVNWFLCVCVCVYVCVRVR